MNTTINKAIIIGASSGIGKELAKILSGEGITLGLAARRVALLTELSSSLPSASTVKQIDASRPESAMATLSELIQEMGQVDLIVFSSGIGDINRSLDWQTEKACIDTNVTGFTTVTNIAIKHFITNGSGHLVAISSVAALRGGKDAPAYNASKAFISNYLEGMRQKVTHLKLPITVSEIRPGFVDTAMAKGDDLFWVATPEKVAQQIYHAITAKKPCVYVSKRWRLIGWLLKLLPGFIYNKL